MPFYEYTGERDMHFKWADQLGQAGMDAYHLEKNQISIDGLPTPLKVKKV